MAVGLSVGVPIPRYDLSVGVPIPRYESGFSYEFRYRYEYPDTSGMGWADPFHYLLIGRGTMIINWHLTGKMALISQDACGVKLAALFPIRHMGTLVGFRLQPTAASRRG